MNDRLMLVLHSAAVLLCRCGSTLLITCTEAIICKHGRDCFVQCRVCETQIDQNRDCQDRLNSQVLGIHH